MSGGPHVHRRPDVLLGVLAAGAVGTALRLAAAAALPHPPEGWPLGTLLVNLVGAACLGALLVGLLRRGPDDGARRVLRVVVGAGLLGGFTTTSALALETAALLGRGQTTTAVGYALVSLVGGLALAAAGGAVTARLVPAGEGRG
jgi:fluoride exporter